MSSALLPSRIFGDGTRRKFPSGMTYYLPLTSNLTPAAGTGGAMTITRASVKRQQNAPNTYVVHGNNELLPTTAFSDIAANGLHVELARTNDVTDSDDMTITIPAGAWTASNCTVSAKNVTDPAGVANQAQTLTPTSNGGYIQNTTAAACSSKNVYGCCWIRRAAGAAGSHTGQLVLTDSAGTVTASRDITVTASWQMFYHEYTGTGAGAETAILRLVPDKTGAQAVDARMPFVEVFADNLIKTLVTPAITTRAADVTGQDCSGTVRGDVGTIYMEIVPLRTVTDGQSGYYLSLINLNAAGTYYLTLYKSAGNMLANYYIGSNQTTSALALNATNWARAVRHKVALRYSSAGVNFYVDGTAGGTRGATTVGDAVPPASCRLRLHYIVNTQQTESIFSNIRYWPRVLADAEMARITR